MQKILSAIMRTLQFVKRHQLIIFLALFALVIVPEVVSAQSGIGANFTNVMNEHRQKIFSTINLVLEFIQILIWPILILIGSLMNNDLLFSGGMQSTLLEVWMVVRDFVNVIFILGILAVAIANIMGVSNENFQIKSVFPRIVIALIAVNFSFFGCKVILDVSNVISTSLFSIPIAQEVVEGTTGTEENRGRQVAAKFCDNINKIKPESKGMSQDSFNQYCKSSDAEGGGKLVPSDLAYQFFGSFHSKNAALVMALQLMEITKITNVNDTLVNDWKDLTVNTLFSLVFMLIYMVAFVALFVGLLVRVVVLWILIAISPLMGLGWAIKPVGERLQFDGKGIMSTFVENAIVTIPIAAILSLGTVMVNAIKKTSSFGATELDPSQFGAIITNTTTVQDLIAGAATAGFIWLAVKQALSKGTGGKFAQMFTSMIESRAKDVAKLPLYMPFLPVKVGEGGKAQNVGLATLGGFLNRPAQYIRDQQNRIADLTGNQSQKIKNDLTSARTPATVKDSVGKAVVAGVTTDKDFQSALAQALGKSGVRQDFQNLKFTVQGAGNVSYQDFIKALDENKVTKADFDDMIRRKVFNDQTTTESISKSQDFKGTLKQVANSQSGAVKVTLDRQTNKFDQLIDSARQDSSKVVDLNKKKANLETLLSLLNQIGNQAPSPEQEARLKDELTILEVSQQEIDAFINHLRNSQSPTPAP